ncbi:MAG: stage III sporulation protein AC [Clostridia bacterium]|jgi:stage III sporulation protein AC|nr:stage III sporulation protein AC [Clostridiaceae bacterium]
MEIDLIFKIASVGIIVAVLNTLLKNSNRDEQAMMVTIAGLIIVLMVIAKEISSLFSAVRNLFNL